MTHKTPPEHKAGLSREQFEEAVFDSATLFVVACFQGVGKYARHEYTDLRDAVMDAINWDDPWLRRPTITAVAPSGRTMVMDREHYAKWLKRWEEKHPEAPQPVQPKTEA